MAKASVREISRITGFSPATVSNALNRKRSVSEETAKVILECAQSLGYQQSTQLESIQFVLARKTGAILDESTFHPAVIEGVERQARRHGMSTSFVSLDFSDLNAVRPQVERLIADPAAAIVLMGTELGEEDYALFANAAAHLIVLDGWSDRQYFDAVVIANTDSVLRAVDYLIGRVTSKSAILPATCASAILRTASAAIAKRLRTRALRPIRHGASPWAPRSRAPIVTWVLGSIRSRTTICRQLSLPRTTCLPWVLCVR